MCYEAEEWKVYLNEKEYDPGKIKRVMLGDYEIPDTQKTQFFMKMIKHFC